MSARAGRVPTIVRAIRARAALAVLLAAAPAIRPPVARLVAQESERAAPAVDSTSAEVLPTGVLRARVTGLAGSTIYLSFDSAPPLPPGAVVAATRGLDEPPAGALEVLELAGARALARYDGDPFPITRGETLLLAVPGSARIARADTAGAGAKGDAAAATLAARAGATISGPRLSGVLALESDLRRSASHYTGPVDGTIERTFATPGARLRATLGGLPGGVRASASLRAYHRERDSRRPLDESRVQVYQAYVEAEPARAPVRFMAGRFLHPYEPFADYWDGGLIRFGSRTVGVGGSAGYAPSLTEEGLEQDLLKYGGFLDVNAGRGRTRYAAALAGTRLEPRGGGPPRTVGALSQRVWAGAIGLWATAEAERDTADRWVISRLTAGATVRAGRLQLRGVASRLRAPLDVAFDPNLDPLRAGPRIGEPRDRAGGGLSVLVAAGSIGGDVTFSRDRQQRDSRTYAGYAVMPRALPGATGLQLSGFYWEDELGNRVVSGSAGLSRSFGPVRADLAYRFDRSDRSAVPITSHGLQLSIAFRASGGWDYRVSGFARRGADLETEQVYTRLTKSF